MVDVTCSATGVTYRCQAGKVLSSHSPRLQAIAAALLAAKLQESSNQ